MTKDDRFFRFRVQLFARARQVGVSRACRELGYHRSTYYRWKPLVERHGLEILRPRERRRPRMPNQQPPWVEAKVIASALAHPGLGPRRMAPQLELWSGLRISASGVLKVLARHGLQTRARRLGLVADYRAPAEPELRPAPEPPASGSGAAGRSGSARLLLYRPAEWDSGSELSIHRHRRRQLLRLGGSPHHPCQSRRQAHLGLGSTCRL